MGLLRVIHLVFKRELERQQKHLNEWEYPSCYLPLRILPCKYHEELCEGTFAWGIYDFQLDHYFHQLVNAELSWLPFQKMDAVIQKGPPVGVLLWGWWEIADVWQRSSWWLPKAICYVAEGRGGLKTAHAFTVFYCCKYLPHLHASENVSQFPYFPSIQSENPHPATQLCALETLILN